MRNSLLLTAINSSACTRTGLFSSAPLFLTVINCLSQKVFVLNTHKHTHGHTRHIITQTWSCSVRFSCRSSVLGSPEVTNTLTAFFFWFILLSLFLDSACGPKQPATAPHVCMRVCACLCLCDTKRSSILQAAVLHSGCESVSLTQIDHNCLIFSCSYFHSAHLRTYFSFLYVVNYKLYR